SRSAIAIPMEPFPRFERFYGGRFKSPERMDIQSVVLPIVALVAGWLVGYLAMLGPNKAERAKSEALEKELDETYSEARGLDEKLRATREEHTINPYIIITA